jgi:hypothetical protein
MGTRTTTASKKNAASVMNESMYAFREIATNRTTYARKKLAISTEQIWELAALSQNVAYATAKRLKAGIIEAFVRAARVELVES